jgi:DNA-binding CsgD family transcriptional regulator
MFASTERLELAALWDELVAGTSKVESWAHGADSWQVVVVKSPTPPRPSDLPRARDLEILEHTLLCGVRKVVAVQVGLSCSSIAVIMQSCFQFMGLNCLPSRIPGLVVAAAHAHHHQGRRLQAQLRGSSDRSFVRQTLSVARPDGVLAPWLAPAELAVISLLVEGQTYAEIAQARQTSVRTVANQVASGFRRLSVSGRAELLCLLARWSLEPPEPPVRRPSSSVPSATKRSISQGLQLLRGVSNGLSPSPAS